jgi:hypothetical protein
VDYVISDVGVGDVLGTDAVKVSALEQPARDKLKRIAAKHAPVRGDETIKFVLVTDLERCDEDTLLVPSVVTSAPNQFDRKQCSLMAFVAAKSLERCATARISCNCGAHADYQTRDQTNVLTCSHCRTKIGLLGIAGDGEAVHTINADGSPGSAPIQCRDRFTVPGVAVN